MNKIQLQSRFLYFFFRGWITTPKKMLYTLEVENTKTVEYYVLIGIVIYSSI